MKCEVTKIFKAEGFCAVANWSIGVYRVDWEPGLKWYAGILVNGRPPYQCYEMGLWFKTKRCAVAYAEKEATHAQAVISRIPTKRALEQTP